MKKQTLYRIAVSILVLLCGSLPASAQSWETMMIVQVPFDFEVREKLLPAGSYVIKRDPQIQNFLLLQSAERKISVIVSTTPHSLSEQPARTSLTFKKYGEEHFLFEVNDSRDSFAYSLTKSKAERRLLAQIAEARTIHATRAIPNGATTNN